MPILNQRTNWSHVEEDDTCLTDDCQGTMKIIKSPAGIYYLECDQNHGHGRIATNLEENKYRQEVELNG